MLQENQSYLMKIIFDDLEYVLPLVTGKNPKFNFDQIITKQLKFDQLQNKYVEIILYSLPFSIDIYACWTKEKLLEKAEIYSSYKISLLTIVVGPECQNFVLNSPKNKKVHLGRIMYIITCKQIANINIKINSVKISLDNLLNNEISLKLKYHDHKTSPNSSYTTTITPNILQKEKKTEFEFDPKNGENNPLNLHIKTSMYDLTSADSSLNVYTIKLINNQEEVIIKDTLFQENTELNTTNKIEKSDSNIKLINHYTMVGFSILSFLDILSENDEALNRQSSQFFRHVSGFNMPKEDEKEENNVQIFTFQVFQDMNRLYNTPLYYEGAEIGKCEIDIDINNVPLIRQIMCGVMTENGFEINSIHLYDNILSGEGNTLPNEITSLINIKRNFNNELIKQKQIQTKFNHEFNLTILGYLKDFKKNLCKTVELELGCLYYGYSDNKDLYSSQNVILDLGLILIKIIDKLNRDQRNLIFEILKLINERSELDLGTLSTKWFKDKNTNEGIMAHNKYVFMDESLLKNKIIENFLEFNYNCLKYSLETINRGKMVDPQSLEFAEFYLKIAYFRIPFFRQMILSAISIGVTEKIEDLLNQGSNYRNMKKRATRITVVNFIESDPINSLLLWEGLFYNKLNCSLEENDRNEKIENEIKDKINKIKDYIEFNNKNSNNILAKDEKKNEWKVLFSQRDYLFFDLIKNLVNYIKSKGEANSDVNWMNIVGFDILFNAFVHEIHVRQVKSFPQQFKDNFKLFINNPDLTNALIKEVVYKTNLYDVAGIFNLIDIINSLFYEFQKNNNKGEIFLKFNYNLLNQVDKCIFKVDHSLCVSKIILLYYNCAHIMSVFHLGEILQTTFFSKFYDLFFHWSYEVRDKFYYFILFIIGHRIKDSVPFRDLEDLKYIKKTSNTEMNGNTLNMHKCLGDILENKFKIIKELQNIIKSQKYDTNFNNVIDPIKNERILKAIPTDVHKNIVIGLHHYEKVYEEYKLFNELNSKKNKNEIHYPELELIPPRDD
jgi:hypothetical protein